MTTDKPDRATTAVNTENSRPAGGEQAPSNIAASSGSVIMHRKIAVTFAAVLLLGGTSAGFAQGTGRGGAPTPGTGMGGAPTPGIGTGGPARAPTPGVGTGGSTNSSDTLPGMPSGNQSGNPSGNPSGTAPRTLPTLGQTQDADIKAEYLEAIPYKPCPANVRFPNGQQRCLGLP